MILIDDLINDDDGITSEAKVTIDGTEYSGWQIAKPLNYEKEYTTKNERIVMADLVMQGKAIAVQYFSDLTQKQQQEYVAAKLTPPVENVMCSPDCSTDCDCKDEPKEEQTPSKECTCNLDSGVDKDCPKCNSKYGKRIT